MKRRIDTMLMNLMIQHCEPTLRAEVEKLMQKNSKLREALAKYGQHTLRCQAVNASQFPRPDCICGFREALANDDK